MLSSIFLALVLSATDGGHEDVQLVERALLFDGGLLPEGYWLSHEKMILVGSRLAENQKALEEERKFREDREKTSRGTLVAAFGVGFGVAALVALLLVFGGGLR